VSGIINPGHVLPLSKLDEEVKLLELKNSLALLGADVCGGTSGETLLILFFSKVNCGFYSILFLHSVRTNQEEIYTLIHH